MSSLIVWNVLGITFAVVLVVGIVLIWRFVKRRSRDSNDD